MLIPNFLLAHPTPLSSPSGHQRSVIGQLLVEEIVQDRSKFNEAVFNVASRDLANMGITVVSYTLQSIADDVGSVISSRRLFQPSSNPPLLPATWWPWVRPAPRRCSATPLWARPPPSATLVSGRWNFLFHALTLPPPFHSHQGGPGPPGRAGCALQQQY